MKRCIVLSVNDDPQYLYYVPLAVWAWHKIGWEVIIMTVDPKGRYFDILDECQPHHSFNVDRIKGYRDDTITQVSRLYAGHAIFKGQYLMTGDIDMIPLSDYWNPDPNKITIYGHDLADYKHYPICYVGMSNERWIEVMGLIDEYTDAMIKRDLDEMPQAKDPDFFKYWFTDQDLITAKINATQFPRVMVDRGKTKNGLAIGRVDRGGWTLDHEQFIDAHLHRDLYNFFREEKNPELKALWQKKWREHMELLHKVWPNEDFTWFVKYTEEYAKLAP